ncbi:hypothetical protein B5X24_HaOG200638 [Helicoverpa armigera]|uniref:Odorant-binding protein 35 n=1 Tax=Helicoverpa armigera TaxID=29058 RepID=A0A1Z2R8N0_HELAM|nr:odorant-binding protein 35 [Helicoverpa armigera]PZC86747.1 hypothetical protein B5X24_HaOG200638 [Helicoverpa armigera]
MLKSIVFCALIIVASHADVLKKRDSKGASLKPLSVCCDIPELGDPKNLEKCSNPKMPGPCDDIQCIFEASGFLIDRNTLNADAYKNHLMKWQEEHKPWKVAVDRAIEECANNQTRQYLDFPCKAYDVFTCTGIAMLKKCPEAAWKC